MPRGQRRSRGQAADDVAVEELVREDPGRRAHHPERAAAGVDPAVPAKTKAWPCAAMKAAWRASFSGCQRSSASRKAISRPRAAQIAGVARRRRAAVRRQLDQPDRGSSAASARARSREPSVEASSTRISSQSARLCARPRRRCPKRRRGVPDRGDHRDERAAASTLVWQENRGSSTLRPLGRHGGARRRRGRRAWCSCRPARAGSACRAPRRRARSAARRR